MEVTREEASATAAGEGGNQPRNPIPNGNQNPNSNVSPNPNSPHSTRGPKGKSCSGCAYYSSIRKAKSKNPACFGLSKTLQQVPSYVVGGTELDSSEEGRHFKYACVGYSVFLDNKDSSADSQDKTKLPFCVGLEVVLVQKSSASPAGHVPAPAHKTEEHEHVNPPRRYKPPNATADEVLNRFQRNASIVASGVVKNLNKVGNYVKDTLDDILYRRPK